MVERNHDEGREERRGGHDGRDGARVRLLQRQILKPVVERNAGDAEKSITPYTTCDWTAAGDEWITVEPAGGSRGIFAVRLSFGANGTGSPRTGTVTFTAGSCKETYTFTQKAE